MVPFYRLPWLSWRQGTLLRVRLSILTHTFDVLLSGMCFGVRVQTKPQSRKLLLLSYDVPMM